MTNEQREELKKLRSELEAEMFPLIPEKTQELLEKIVEARKPKIQDFTVHWEDEKFPGHFHVVHEFVPTKAVEGNV